METLFEVLLQRQADENTGFANQDALPWPASSGPFIARQEFGTRATTLLWRDTDDHVSMEERRFGPNGVPTGSTGFRLAPGQARA